MKKSILFLLSVFQFSAGAQELVQDPELINLTAENHAEVVIILNEQLATARDQLIRLEEQIGLMGHPAEVVEVPGSEAATEAIGQSMEEGLKPNEELEEMVVGVDGATVFGETLYGLVEPIGETFEDGEETFPRDPELYKPEAAVLDRIKEYQRVREASMARRALLQEAMLEALENVKTAESFAVIQKQRAVIDVLQTEIAAADTEINSASKDVDMLQREFVNQAQIVYKAKNERRPEEEVDEEGEGEEGEGATLDSLRNRRMRWGPRGE